MPGAWPLSPALVRADWVFRNAGKVTIAMLLTTLALRVVGADYWTAIFDLAHLAALVALVPLGVVLVRYGFRRASEAGDGGLLGVLRRYRTVAIILAAIVGAVTVTLVTFEDGPRTLRQTANLTTVAMVLLLVVRYLRWSHTQRGISPARADHVV